MCLTPLLIAVAPLTPLAQDTVHWLLEVVGAISGAWLDLLQLVLTPVKVQTTLACRH